MSAPRLVERPDGAALFLRPAGPVTQQGFLADAHRLAARLPSVDHVLNLCRDRYAFVVAFAAALIRGQVCLLCGDSSAPMLAALRRDYPDWVAIVDEAAADPPPFPTICNDPTGAPGNAFVPAIPAGRQAAIVFTSGSTGVPTAHRKSWGALVARSRAAGQRFGLQETDPVSVVGTVPPGHM
ncbi:MAG: hypothetical protein JOZ05_13330, partial [Acetobacteraceae bacterium]|nr:hypothetical protein [Acetobacteraceae bacterium]